jgi:hypothetical protein
MNDSPDLRPALAYLKAVASEDHDGLRVLTEHGDLPDLVDGLAYLTLLFIEDFSDDAAGHINVMFEAVAATERGHQ